MKVNICCFNEAGVSKGIQCVAINLTLTCIHDIAWFCNVLNILGCIIRTVFLIFWCFHFGMVDTKTGTIRKCHSFLKPPQAFTLSVYRITEKKSSKFSKSSMIQQTRCFL